MTKTGKNCQKMQVLPITDEEVKLENKLATIFYAAFPEFSEDWEAVAKENGVEEGYRLIILNQGESDE